jgi:hypothetical protein
MNYTPEQFTQAVLKALETLNTPDVTKLPLQERKELAYNTNTPPEILTILARNGDWSVRWRVAQNPTTPPEILTILARDEDWSVRYAAQQNPNYTPVKELKVTTKQYEALKALLAASQDKDLKSIQF